MEPGGPLTHSIQGLGSSSEQNIVLASDTKYMIKAQYDVTSYPAKCRAG